MAATAGWAFLKAPGSPNIHNIASLMADVQPTIPANASVHDISTHVWPEFNARWQDHLVQYPQAAAAVPAGQTVVDFIVAGYNEGSRRGELYMVNIPSAVAPTDPQLNTDTGGWWTIGTNDVVLRISTATTVAR
jgi:hypothetical protein